MPSSSFSNGSCFIPYSSDEDLSLEDMDQDDLIIFQMTMLTISNSSEQVISYEMEERGSSVPDILDIMCTTPTLFKSLIYVTLEEFDQLTFQIFLTNKAHVISIGVLLSFISNFNLGLIFKFRVKVKGKG